MTTNPLDLERRSAPSNPIEIRDAPDGSVHLTGYASTFNQPYDMGSYNEQVAPGAFTRTLDAKPDVRLLFNHDGAPLARTTSGTLKLSQDGHGLKVDARLDPTDSDVAALLPKIRRGDLNQMSFGFRIDPDGEDSSYDGEGRRLQTLRSLNLHDGDVSLVTYPANPNTTAMARARQPESPALRMLNLIRSRGMVQSPDFQTDDLVGDDEARSAFVALRDEVVRQKNPATISDFYVGVSELMNETAAELRTASNDGNREARRRAERAYPDAIEVAEYFADEARERSGYALPFPADFRTAKQRIHTPEEREAMADQARANIQGAPMTSKAPTYAEILTRAKSTDATADSNGHAFTESRSATYNRGNLHEVVVLPRPSRFTPRRLPGPRTSPPSLPGTCR